MILSSAAQRVVASWWVLACGAGLALALVPVVRWIALRWAIVDQPGERKVHADAKPLLGGLAVYVAFIATISLNFVAFRYGSRVPILASHMPEIVDIATGIGAVRRELYALMIGTSVVLVTGLLDDFYGERFPVLLKVFGQVVAAAVLMSAGVRTTLLPDALPWDLHNTCLTVLWIVGFTNAFNLLDNMDGLVSGVALIASSILAFVAIQSGQFFVALILCAFSGSLLGFLHHNIHPSSIFLGDAGSLFIGYVMAALALLQSYVTFGESSVLGALMPLIILSLPLFDTASVVWIRLKEGRPIYMGDKCHLSHRLVELGLSQAQAVQIVYLLTFCLGINATILRNVTTIEGIIVALQAMGLMALVAVLMKLGGTGEVDSPATGDRGEPQGTRVTARCE